MSVPDLAAQITFDEIVPSPTLQAALARLNYTHPTPVQAAAIPAALSGRDLIVQAKTGSGKTVAFVIPLLLQLEAEPSLRGTAGLIIAPTRELAYQISEVIKNLSTVQPACLIGGGSIREQEQDLERDNRIVVGTPGRIQDFIRRRTLILRKCRYFVLDEADEMLSMDFVEEVREILSRLPDERQGLFISATITPRVDSLAKSFLTDPSRIVIDTPGGDLPSIEHTYYEVSGELTAKITALSDLLETIRPKSAIIFCNTKSDTELVEVSLRRRGFDARRINSNLSQREREYVMNKIRAGELRFMVGTDIAARGIDIEQIDLVVNYAIPEQPEVYLHRTGRTGRAGRSGAAVSLVGPQDFASFQALKRETPVELKVATLPSEEEVVKARLVHFDEMLAHEKITLHARDHSLARSMLERAGAVQPNDEMVNMLATLCRFTAEHIFKPEALSLEDEIARQMGQAPRPSDQGGRDRRHGGESGRSRGGRRDRGGRHGRHGRR